MGKKSDNLILCIDLGTSGCKAALIDIGGESIGFEFSPVELHLSPGGGAEQNPGDWWTAICETTHRLIENNSVAPDRVIAVCANTQWSGTVAVDSSGNHLMNAIIWMDTRGADATEKLSRGIVNIEGYGITKILRWLRITGGMPSLAGKDPISHILYIRDHFPKIYANTHKFLEVKDYVNLRLTGRFVSTYDAITLHWVTDNRDLSRIDYHPGLLRMTGLERKHLPELARATDIIGTLTPQAAGELGLPESVKVIGGSPDTIAAAVGSGAVREYEGHTYLGTSCWLSAHVPYKKTDITTGIASIPSAIPDLYFVANEQETAGNALTFLKEKILYHQDELLQEEALPDVYKVFDRIAETAPAGANGVLFTPWLIGERTPINDHLIRGGLHNISLENNRADIIRAHLEGVALNQRWVLQAVEKFMKKQFDAINLVGGGGNSDIWCQIHADVFNRPIRQVADPIQSNARGSAFTALVGLGLMRFEDIPDIVRIKNVFEPNPDNRKIYDDIFTEFVNIYHANKKIHARLNRHRH